MAVVAGIDFGTQNVRVAIVDSARGVLGSAVGAYPLIRSRLDPDLATQRHADHLQALEIAFRSALEASHVPGAVIESMAVATTGSSVVPLDEQLRPIADYYLWCDHRAGLEAEAITRVARARNLPALAYCGGAYSAEWGFAKLLHWMRHDPEGLRKFHTAAEHCDYITATLCGIRTAENLPRSICAMGHKWMWNRSLGGLPDEEFLTAVDPLLSGARARLAGNYGNSAQIAGGLCASWAERLGVREGIPVPIGALDAHWDAIGAGCRLGDVVNVIGTSSCILALSASGTPIPGMAGVAEASIHPAFFGIEAGIAAAGDLFDSVALRSGATTATLSAVIDSENRARNPTGILRIPWDNGDRSVLADSRRRGVSIGTRLHHDAADGLLAAMEGVAFQTRIILERMTDHGVPIERVINAGGIPQRSAAMNRVFATVLGKSVLVPEQASTSLGSAIFAFLAAGTFATVEAAQECLCAKYQVIDPDERNLKSYEEIYSQFREVYFNPLFASLFERMNQTNPGYRAELALQGRPSA